jgi:hypothetical protein
MEKKNVGTTSLAVCYVGFTSQGGWEFREGKEMNKEHECIPLLDGDSWCLCGEEVSE